MSNYFKNKLKDRLTYCQDWKHSIDLYLANKEITKKADKEYYKSKPILKLVLNIYFIPYNILRLLRDLRILHEYDKNETEIKVLSKELNDHEKSLFHFQALKNCSEGILCFDFRSQLLGWGTTFRELKVLSKMATGVGDQFPGAQGAVENGYWGGGPLSGSLRCCQNVDSTFLCLGNMFSYPGRVFNYPGEYVQLSYWRPLLG